MVAFSQEIGEKRRMGNLNAGGEVQHLALCGVRYDDLVPMAEKALIELIRRIAAGKGIRRQRPRRSRSEIVAGIGDDCAVLRVLSRRGRDREIDTLVTTDFSLEGIHFRRDWHPAESVGHRCLARGLSDIAAMGGDPVAAFLSLALPRRLSQTWVNGFIRGLTALAEKYEVSLAGGDTAESPDGVLADIMVVGAVAKGTSVFRSGAKPGDRIYVSGELGGSAAAVSQMREKPGFRLQPKDYPRHFFPEPRVGLGRMLREKRIASAMIDTSDGLSTDLAHICELSGVGAEVIEESIPQAKIGKQQREVDLKFALHGGEDYELLFTAPRNRRVPRQIAGVPITQIGWVTRTSKVILTSDRTNIGYELQPQGWEHFHS